MRVPLRRLTVRGPSRVSDAHVALSEPACCQVWQTALWCSSVFSGARTKSCGLHKHASCRISAAQSNALERCPQMSQASTKVTCKSLATA
eukprot:2097748-Rhodomonas_salina.1